MDVRIALTYSDQGKADRVHAVMSTLPQDPTLATGAAITSPTRAERDLEPVCEFVAMAEQQGISFPPAMELCELYRQAADLTAEIFGGKMEVEVVSDPEIRGELHFTFEVAASDPVDEIVKRENAWHFKLRRLVGTRAELFCLSVNVR